MSRTSEEKRASTLKLFQVLDANRSGFIEPEELDNFLQIMGVSDEAQRQEQIPVLLARMDIDGDGVISFEEFFEVATKMELDIESTLHAAESTGTVSTIDENPAEEEDSERLFEELDTDHDGFIAAEDLAVVLKDRCGITEASQQDKTLRDHFQLTSRTERISRQSFISRNQGLIRRRSSLFKLFSEGNTAPLTYATSSLSQKKRNQMWALFCFADDDRDGLVTIRQIADVISEKKTSEIIDMQDIEVLEQLVADNPQGIEFDFNSFCLEYVMFTEAPNPHCNYPTAARAFSAENRKLRNRLAVVEEENDRARKSIESRASVEQLELLKAHDATEEELRAVLEDMNRLKRENKTLLQKVDALRGENEILDRDLNLSGSTDKALTPTHMSMASAVDSEEVTELRQRVDNLNMALVQSMRDHADQLDLKRREIQQLHKEKMELKLEKEHLDVRLMNLAKASTKKSIATADDTLRSLSLQQELELVREQLESQKKLAFALSSEKEVLEQKLEEVDAGGVTTAADAGLGNHKEQMEILNTKLHSTLQHLRETQDMNRVLQDELTGYREREASTSPKEVQNLPTAVADSAAPPLKRDMSTERLRSDLVITQNKLRSTQAQLEILQREHTVLRAQRPSYAAIPSATVAPSEQKSIESLVLSPENAVTPLAVQYIQTIASLKKENRMLKKTIKKLHAAYTQAMNRPAAGNALTKYTDHELADQVATLKKELYDATGEIGELTLKLEDSERQLFEASMVNDDLRVNASSASVAETGALRKRLEEMTKKLDDAMDALRRNSNTACVQTVQKVVIEHTKFNRKGERQVVSVDKPPAEVFTYFTDDSVQAQNNGPWTDTEDRILLQTQLRVGGDWLEIAKQLPGRSDTEVKHRWVELTQALVEHSQSHRASRLFSDKDMQIGVNLRQHNDSTMSRRSEGVYDLANIEREEATSHEASRAGSRRQGANKTTVLATV